MYRVNHQLGFAYGTFRIWSQASKCEGKAYYVHEMADMFSLGFVSISFYSYLYGSANKVDSTSNILFSKVSYNVSLQNMVTGIKM